MKVARTVLKGESGGNAADLLSYLKALHSNAKRYNMPKYAQLPNHYPVFQRHLQLADYREVEYFKCFSVKVKSITRTLSEAEVRKIEAQIPIPHTQGRCFPF